MEHVFDPLNKKEFKSRMAESFPAVYLTAISIIQGVALGILASNTFCYIKDPNLAEPWIRFLPYSVTSLIFLIVVTYEYTWFVGIFKYSPKIWDTIIPFVLGASEIAPMFYLTNPRIWWVLVTIFCFFGAWGFLNTLRNCKEPMFGENEQAYRRTRNTLKWDISIAMVGAVISSFAGILSPIKVWYWETPFWGSVIGIVTYMIVREEKFLKALHRDFGLVR